MRGLHFDHNLRAAFGRKLTALVAMSALMAFNFAPLQATATTTVVNCSGGGDFVVYDSGAGIVAGTGTACAGTAEIPANVTAIADYGFYNSRNLTAITFAPGINLTSIGKQAFENSGLVSIAVPDTVVTFGARAFVGNNNLTSVTFGPGSQLTTIGNDVWNNTGQSAVALPATVAAIGKGIFGKNSRVTIADANPNFSIQNGVLFNKDRTRLISYAPWLADATYVIPDSVTSLGNGCFSGSALETINIPASVLTLGSNIIASSTRLTNVTFSSNSAITIIPAYAFGSSALVNVEIPASVTSIGSFAFGDSRQLTTVSFASGSRLGSIGFNALGSMTATLELPASPYRNGFRFTGWSNTSKGTPIPSASASVLAGQPLFALWAVGPTITAGSVIDSQVISIPSGLTDAEVLATANFPRVNLAFGAIASSAVVTLSPMANPAAPAATPFVVTGSTKFVDMQVSGISGPLTVCLEGAPTDDFFLFTAGAWAASPQRSYVNGQVCGVTENFSPFAVAEARAIVPQAASGSSGPVGPRINIDARLVLSTNGQSLALKGIQLSQVVSVKLAGKEIKIIRQTDDELVVEVPAGAEGFPDLELSHESGVTTYQGMIEIIKPYTLTRSIKITKFVGSRPTLAGLSALYKVYQADRSVNLLTCVITVASDASGEDIANAESLGKSTCQRVVNYSRQIKNAQTVVKQDGAKGSKPVVEITFDRTLSAGRG